MKGMFRFMTGLSGLREVSGMTYPKSTTRHGTPGDSCGFGEGTHHYACQCREAQFAAMLEAAAEIVCGRKDLSKLEKSLEPFRS